MRGIPLSCLRLQRTSRLSTLLKREEVVCALLFLGASGIAWSVAVLKGLSGCPLCAAQRLGLAGIGVGFLISLRLPILGALSVGVASTYVMERAYLQLVLENGVRLEQFAYVWSLYTQAPEESQKLFLPHLQPFYSLLWPFKKLATYSLGLGFLGMALSVKQSLKGLARKGLGRERFSMIRFYGVSKIVLCIALLDITMTLSHAKDFGTQGAVFEMREQDMQDDLTQRISQYDIGILHHAWERHVEAWSPRPVLGLKTTITPRTFTFDPTFVVPSSLKDHEGRVFAPRGLKVNPLKILPFKGTMVFIQGDAHLQKKWAQTLPHETKVVLVSGSPLSLMKEMGRILYFDQGGVLTKRLAITQVPAMVVQEGDRLRVEEKREADL